MALLLQGRGYSLRRGVHCQGWGYIRVLPGRGYRGWGYIRVLPGRGYTEPIHMQNITIKFK